MSRLVWRLGAAIAAAAVVVGFWFVFGPALPDALVPLDRDASGALEPDEVGPLLAERFPVVDRDGDGALRGPELRRWLLGAWLAGRGASVASRSGAALPVDDPESVLRRWLDRPVAAGELDGVGLILVRGGTPVFRHAAGDASPARAQPLGEAGLWPAAAVFGCLDARGELGLDAPLAAVLGDLPGRWGATTPLALLAQIAGAPDARVAQLEPTVPLERVGRMLVSAYALPPDPVLRPGPVGPQVAAWAAEAATGRSWRRLFVECVSWPLSLESAAWGHPGAGVSRSGFAHVQAGAWLSLEDYARFLAMWQQFGRYGGVPNLPASVIAVMERDHAGGLPRASLPRHVRPEWGHAVGPWCERVDEAGRCRLLTVHGRFGTHAWLDRDTGLAGVLMTGTSLSRSAAWMRSTRERAQALYGR